MLEIPITWNVLPDVLGQRGKYNALTYITTPQGVSPACCRQRHKTEFCLCDDGELRWK